MPDILRPIFELTVVIPGILLAYFPMKHQLRLSYRKILVLLLPLLILLCLAGGWLCWSRQIPTLPVLLCLILICGAVYHSTLHLNPWKALNVFLSVCAAYTCLNSFCRALNTILAEDNRELYFCLYAGAIYNGICWLFTAACWYPASHSVVALMDTKEMLPTRFFFWLLPAIFIALNLFITPTNPTILYIGRLNKIYIATTVTLLFLLCLFFATFHMFVRGLTRNNALQQENQFLSLQQSQYSQLLTTIDETREARHDLRHHFQVLSGLLRQGKSEEAMQYLAQAQQSIPSGDIFLCANPALNAVAGHYAALYQINQIPYSMRFELPESLPLSEMDLCVVLSNLLENAMEASLRTDPDTRYIRAHAYLHSPHVLLLCVENAYSGTIVEKNGLFRSSKRKGIGIGLQSVRRISEKQGGSCRFTYDDGIFCVNVLLRGTQDANSDQV